MCFKYVKHIVNVYSMAAAIINSIKHMLIEPLANQEVIKSIRRTTSGYFLTRKELFINHTGLLLLLIALK